MTTHTYDLPTATADPTTNIETGLLEEYARNPVRRGPVVLGVDGTGSSAGPAMAAKLLAERLDVPLEIVTVLEPVPLSGNTGSTPSTAAPGIESLRRDERMGAVEQYAQRLRGTPPPRIRLRYGSIAREIAAEAREVKASVVVVGAAPHRRLNRIVGGERAAQILRHCECPVLSIAPGFSEFPRQAVVGIDFSPPSVRAAVTALLLLAHGGTLTLLHALEPAEVMARLRDDAGRDFDEAVQQLFSRLRAELTPYVPSRTTVSTSVVTGDAVTALLETAEAAGAELIAVGTHGPTLAERMFVGSVATSVLHAAEQTVIAAPPPSVADALGIRLRLWGTSMTKKPNEWRDVLEAFSRRNAHRRVTMEVDDPTIGAQIAQTGYRLLGVAYDPHDARVEIMLGDSANPVQHLTHAIARPASIAMSIADDGRDEALEVTHGEGHTLLIFSAQ